MPRLRQSEQASGLFGGRLLCFESLGSTNSWLLDHATDCHHGDVVMADSQTRGRGRFDRAWLALPGKSLTFSIFIRRGFMPPETLPSLAPLSAIAVHSALTRLGLKAWLKWPNDVWVDGRKISGILMEGGNGEAVVGIGVNVALTASDLTKAGLGRTSTSIRIASGRPITPIEFYKVLVPALERWLSVSERRQVLALRHWQRHDVLAGRRIRVATATGRLHGDYAGVAADWRLRLKRSNGEIALLSAGDVTLH